MSLRQLTVILLVFSLLIISSSACTSSSPQPSAIPTQVFNTGTPVSTPEPTATPVPPTATPVPMAAIVNGEGITMEEYQAELTRFQVATAITGTLLATDTSAVVLNELIDQTLLAQAASENGYIVDDSLLNSRIDALTTQLGGAQALQTWQNENGYTPDTFSVALRRSIGAAWMRDLIVSGVPQTADQVHVIQILVPKQAEADQIIASLQSGEDFQQLAAKNDPITNGDLGWFPRGYLSDQKIEEAAFNLQVDQYSEVIQTDIGFHILYLLERDAEHPLLPDAKRVLQEKAVQDWLSERKKQSEIQILVP